MAIWVSMKKMQSKKSYSPQNIDKHFPIDANNIINSRTSRSGIFLIFQLLSETSSYNAISGYIKWYGSAYLCFAVIDITWHFIIYSGHFFVSKTNYLRHYAYILTVPNCLLPNGPLGGNIAEGNEQGNLHNRTLPLGKILPIHQNCCNF